MGAARSSWDTTLAVDGDWDLRVITTDNAGNSVTSPAISVTVDNTDPSLSVSAPNPVNLSSADPATVSANASDTGTGIANLRFDQCAEDSPTCLSDTWVLLGLDTGAPYQASWSIPSDGPRLLRVRATDNAGRQNTELVLVTVDRTRPAGSLTAPSAGADVRGANVGLTATASDTAPGTVNTVTFQRSPAGAGTWSDVVTDSTAPYAGTFERPQSDGLYDLRLHDRHRRQCRSHACDDPGACRQHAPDRRAIRAPADAADVRGTVALTSSSADTGSGVAAVASSARPPAPAPGRTRPRAGTRLIPDGLVDLRVVTTDNAGNVRTSSAITVRIDNTDPTGGVTTPAGGANVRGTVTLSSNSADAGSGVATVVFQRSPAGTGAWTNQARAGTRR